MYSCAVPITKSDSLDIPETVEAIYVGTTGVMVLQMKDGSNVTFTGALAGTIYPITGVKKILSTNTTAGAFVGLW